VTRRLLLSIGAAALVLLVAEGLLSLAFGRSLRGEATELSILRVAGRGREGDLAAAEPRTPGLYRIHRDPLVGYAVRARAELAILDSVARTDALGLRVRPGPPDDGSAQRIAVLGDSVAFGFGLDDDETLAHRLEQELNAVRPIEAPPVVCRTVATPGWNHRNAVHFLLDHLDQIEPELVVYLPIGNDLVDTDGLWEFGRRRMAPDPSSADPWLHVGMRTMLPSMSPELESRAVDDPAGFLARLGPANLVSADLSPESSRRFDENARSIALLAERLQRHGSRLMLAQYVEDPYVWHLRRRLDELGLSLPVTPLFERLTDGLSLEEDPHLNAEAVAVMARWIAAELLESGWVAGDAAALSPVEPAFDELRAAERDPAEIVALSDAARAEARQQLRSVVDWETFEGLNQVYSTLNPDGTAGARLLVALAPSGERVQIVLEPLESRPDLYPLAVGVEIDGNPVGTLPVTADETTAAEFALPERSDRQAPIEVRLVPERWVVIPQDASSAVASFRPLRIASR
jgi:hypothetical protein